LAAARWARIHPAGDIKTHCLGDFAQSKVNSVPLQMT